MKKICKTLSILLTISICLCGCGKEAGEIGPKGDQGIQGEQGIPGKDGAVILKGNGAPAISLGKVGDMYIDVTNSMLYGPKIENAWGSPLNLKGAQGTQGPQGPQGNQGAPGPAGPTGANGKAGADGSKILSGTTNPATRTGELGDYYLNKTTGDFFGPKAAGGWGTAINLKGTANVVASPILDIAWSNFESYGEVFTYIIPTPYFNAIGEISLKSMLDKGGVLICYIVHNNYQAMMPFTFTNNSKSIQYQWLATHQTAIQLNRTVLDMTSISNFPSNSFSKFRFVLIPAGRQLTASTGKIVLKEELEKMSFQQIENLLKHNNL